MTDLDGVTLIEEVSSLRNLFGILRKFVACRLPDEFDLSPLPELALRLRARRSSYEGFFLACALGARPYICSLSARLGALS